MKIFADKNILALESHFSPYGELHFFDGRKVKREDLVDADALLVRSVTEVNESLLAGTAIRFVGTATSGIDHVDTTYLSDVGIHFRDAKGCNANAVVDYCFTALAYAELHRGFSLKDSRVGIVGGGAVGGLLAAKRKKLGVELRCYDPFLAEEMGEKSAYCSFEEALNCDVVSLHVPLTTDGPYPTLELLGASELATLKKNAVLINACRGGVVDESALKQLLSEREDIISVFDVWLDEPGIDSSLAELVDIATPHIAGYSAEAKSNATKMLARAFEKYLGLEVTVEERDAALRPITLQCAANSLSPWKTLLTALPLDRLSEQFKQALREGGGAETFDVFRKELLHRRQFENTLLKKDAFSGSQREVLSALGFSFEED